MGTQRTLPSEADTAGILNLFMYLDYKNADAGLPLSRIITQIEQDSKYWERYGNDESKRTQLGIIKEALAYNPELGKLEMGLQRYENGVNAAVFRDGSRAYVVYRGTGDGLWIDNGRGMTQDVTGAQQGSADFLDEAAALYGWNASTDLTVTGHSKGGNNAQSSTLNAESGGLVDRCISFDGQGMSPSAIEHFRERLGEEYDSRIERMYSICGENDPINPLGKQLFLDDHVAYIETNAGLENLASTHALEYLYCQGQDENGNYIFGCHFNGQTEQGAIGRYAARLSEIMMKLPEGLRDDIAVSIMQLIEFGEEQKKGYDGDHAGVEDWVNFLEKGIPIILYSLIVTEEGRDAMAELLGDVIRSYYEKYGEQRTVAMIAACLAAAPVAILVIQVGLGEIDRLLRIQLAWQTVIGIMEDLGMLTEEIKKFLEQCWQAVEEFADQTKNWIKTHLFGKTVFCDAQFHVETAQLFLAAQIMRDVRQKLEEAVSGMALVRRSLPYYGLGGSAVRAGIAAVEYRTRIQVQKLGRMAVLAENTGRVYRNYELGIAGQPAASD